MYSMPHGRDAILQKTFCQNPTVEKILWVTFGAHLDIIDIASIRKKSDLKTKTGTAFEIS